eukprot:CAMPEP_0206034448 /NCGR_PEP_ID=MMETSP1466-20131121/1365_1 /ASSEMBLY_ACC=CAM_ASM_001126 /TAXON_ID=44452 /ORGANISM="Pavlova gyrans, Strain CCMP608" /LENGTH=99 /DNA_ID=CAMNT_0053408745 /DNA_START=609 /DNA_END=905 /DNA_ORIENTATION=-
MQRARKEDSKLVASPLQGGARDTIVRDPLRLSVLHKVRLQVSAQHEACAILRHRALSEPWGQAAYVAVVAAARGCALCTALLVGSCFPGSFGRGQGVRQ